MANNDETESPTPKPVRWIASSRRDMQRMPKPVRVAFGGALFDAQTGKINPAAKPLKGFTGASVVEIVESFEGNAYRAVYTVKFRDFVFVLHVFQKKSKSGRATPVADIEKIKVRLKQAEAEYEEWLAQQERSEEE